MVAAYNLENLFDLKHQGTEYPGYVPDGDAGWDRGMLEIKLDRLSRVISDLSPQIIGLQEVESERALQRLLQALHKRGADYPHAAIADNRDSTVKCALLSVYPVSSATEIRVPGEGSRNILQAEIDINGHRLVVFVNHWKAKSGPESRRLAYARALAAAVRDLPENTDYLLMGDFNSNYNEFETMEKRPSLDDTGGKTGINHVLKTVYGGDLVDESRLAENSDKFLHYNLWLELPEKRRWSSLFFNRPQSPDAILLPAALYDDHGVSYADNSFDKYDPGYLFAGDVLKRWQRAQKGRGHHLGRGFSDHLPVYACFTTSAFSPRTEPALCAGRSENARIADLYESKTGAVHHRLKGCAVIYRHKDNAVVRNRGGRAIYIYEAARDLRKGRVYDITVSRLKRYYGNLEITGIADFRETGRISDPQAYSITDPDANFTDPALRNAVIGSYSGRYADGRFFYGNNRQIRLYFSDSSLEPESPAQVRIRHARIGFHKSPELVIEKSKQIEVSPDPTDRGASKNNRKK
ncbi:MAG: endonuclease/exonuclease/phosphatase family protein [Desulfosalsimonas sp.]